jgi:lipid II:glycine glycyltransferase (peptidoglycan interpeptide bridge formation enzyme)
LSNSKQKYQSFCLAESLPVFVQPWYLDVVCGEAQWEVVVVEEKNKVLAALPYHLKKKGPFEIIAMPWLCKMMGPYFAADYRDAERSRKLMMALVEQLPEVSAFHQNFHYQITDWLPFYWKQYQQTTSYTYLLDDLSDLEKVYAAFHSDFRNNKIKKAEKILQVKTDLSLDIFFEVQQKTFERQGLDFVIPFSFLKRFDEVLKGKKSGETFFAVDEDGRVHSVVYLIWDKETAYYLLAGDDPNLRNSGSGIFLIWEVIKYTKNVLGLNCFDFQGSMIPSIEKVRRSFGARQVPYFQIWKEASRLYRWQKWLRGRD